MLLDLLCTGNYISFNSQLANILGLKEAIYLSEIMNINSKAIKKSVTVDGGFTLDRQYLCSRTTITEEEQLSIEDRLSKVGIVEKNEENSVIQLNINVLTTIMMSQDEQLTQNIEKLVKLNSAVSKKTKKQAMIDNLKKLIHCENAELQEAYEGWIEGVMANPNGFLSKKSIEIFQKNVDAFADHNLDVALTIIDIATVNGYRDATWAINTFKKEHGISYRLNPNVSNVEVRTQVSENEVF